MDGVIERGKEPSGVEGEEEVAGEEEQEERGQRRGGQRGECCTIKKKQKGEEKKRSRRLYTCTFCRPVLDSVVSTTTDPAPRGIPIIFSMQHSLQLRQISVGKEKKRKETGLDVQYQPSIQKRLDSQ